MTLDEAIQHAVELGDVLTGSCAEEHMQLASWLIELKRFKQDEENIIAKVLWVEDDIQTALIGRGKEPIKENVDKVLNHPKIIRLIEESGVEAGWEAIEYVMSEISFNEGWNE
jgi:hypothetical protein